LAIIESAILDSDAISAESGNAAPLLSAARPPRTAIEHTPMAPIARRVLIRVKCVSKRRFAFVSGDEPAARADIVLEKVRFSTDFQRLCARRAGLTSASM
jgi:hypothetical protein